MTASIQNISISGSTALPLKRSSGALDREVASRLYGSYNDRLAGEARRRGDAVGGGALGAIPAVDLPAPVAPPASSVAASERVSRGRESGAASLGEGTNRGAGPRGRATDRSGLASETPQQDNGGSNHASEKPTRVDGQEETKPGDASNGNTRPVARPRGALFAQLNAGTAAARSNVASGAAQVAGVRSAGGNAPAGIGAQRLRVGAASTTPRTQTTKPVVRDALIDQIQRGLAKALQNKDGEITVRLRPENLGLVKVQVRVEDSHVTAALKATDEQARELLSQNVVTLERALEARGLIVDRIVVEHDPASVTDDGSRESRGQRGGASTREWHGRSPTRPGAEHADDEQASAARERHAGGIHIDAIA